MSFYLATVGLEIFVILDVSPEVQDNLSEFPANAGDKSNGLEHGLDSSMTSFVTVTKTVTETVKLPVSACSQP